MADKSKINWTEATWNPVTGCSKVSEGCRHCYAEREWPRLAGNSKSVYFGRKFSDVKCHPERLDQPLRWTKPRMIFVNSMSDLFHPDVPFEFIAKVYDIIKQCPKHTFQILTKRVDRALEFYKWNAEQTGHYPGSYGWLKNVWFMATTENQDAANDRIPKLLQIPAYTRGISAEPLLSNIKISGLIPPPGTRFKCSFCGGYTKSYSLYCQTCGKEGGYSGSFAKLNIVIVGGESGPSARPMHPEWVRNLRDQCLGAGVAFFFKQWGEWAPYGNDRYTHGETETMTNCQHYINPDGSTGVCWIYDADGSWQNWNGEPQVHCAIMNKLGKKKAGRLLDGREWNEMPSGY